MQKLAQRPISERPAPMPLADHAGRPGRLSDRRPGGLRPQRAAPDGGGHQGHAGPPGARPGAPAAPAPRQRVDGGGQAPRPTSPSPGWRTPPSWSRPRGRCSRATCNSWPTPPSARSGGTVTPVVDAGAGRQPLRRSGVELQSLLRLLEAGLSHHRPLAAGHAGQDPRPRRAHAPARQLLPQADRERVLALQLPAHQPRGPARDGRLERREPGAGHGQPACTTCSGRAPMLNISQTDVDAFEVGRNVATAPGKVDLAERRDAAHPVRADHREGARPAAADRAALDQQVLHPRSRPGEIVHPLSPCRRASPCSW